MYDAKLILFCAVPFSGNEVRLQDQSLKQPCPLQPFSQFLPILISKPWMIQLFAILPHFFLKRCSGCRSIRLRRFRSLQRGNDCLEQPCYHSMLLSIRLSRKDAVPCDLIAFGSTFIVPNQEIGKCIRDLFQDRRGKTGFYLLLLR